MGKGHVIAGELHSGVESVPLMQKTYLLMVNAN